MNDEMKTLRDWSPADDEEYREHIEASERAWEFARAERELRDDL